MTVSRTRLTRSGWLVLNSVLIIVFGVLIGIPIELLGVLRGKLRATPSTIVLTAANAFALLHLLLYGRGMFSRRASAIAANVAFLVVLFDAVRIGLGESHALTIVLFVFTLLFFGLPLLFLVWNSKNAA